MSREDLVHAYADGQLSRRVFVRRLVAAGVSLGAALAYADITADRAHAGGHDPCDHYDHYKPKKPKKPKKDKKPR